MNKQQNITIIGSGALGTALAKILYDTGRRDILIYGIDDRELNDLKNGKNARYFSPQLKLPKFNTSADLTSATQTAHTIILAVPSKIVNAVINSINPLIRQPTLIISGIKGFYSDSNLSAHEGIAAAMKNNKNVRGVVSLIGPSFAEEMIKEYPTSLAAVNESLDLCYEVQKMFSNHYFRVYAQTDVKGANAASAFKNVLALASGMTALLGGGINTIAALLTRGLVEMTTFIEIVGGNPRTVMGLTGVGDLILTATSPLSRNFSAGRQIALHGIDSLDERVTVEGIVALEHIYTIAKSNGRELPIVNFLYEVIINKTKQPQDFRSELWDRKLKAE